MSSNPGDTAASCGQESNKEKTVHAPWVGRKALLSPLSDSTTLANRVGIGELMYMERMYGSCSSELHCPVRQDD